MLPQNPAQRSYPWFLQGLRASVGYRNGRRTWRLPIIARRNRGILAQVLLRIRSKIAPQVGFAGYSGNNAQIHSLAPPPIKKIAMIPARLFLTRGGASEWAKDQHGNPLIVQLPARYLQVHRWQ